MSYRAGGDPPYCPSFRSWFQSTPRVFRRSPRCPSPLRRPFRSQAVRHSRRTSRPWWRRSKQTCCPPRICQLSVQQPVCRSGPDAAEPGEGAPLGEATSPGLVEVGAGAEVFTPGSRSSGRGGVCMGAAGAGGGGPCWARAPDDTDTANRPTAIQPAAVRDEVLTYIVMLLLSEAEPPPGGDCSAGFCPGATVCPGAELWAGAAAGVPGDGVPVAPGPAAPGASAAPGAASDDPAAGVADGRFNGGLPVRTRNSAIQPLTGLFLVCQLFVTLERRERALRIAQIEVGNHPEVPIRGREVGIGGNRFPRKTPRHSGTHRGVSGWHPARSRRRHCHRCAPRPS